MSNIDAGPRIRVDRRGRQLTFSELSWRRREQGRHAKRPGFQMSITSVTVMCTDMNMVNILAVQSSYARRIAVRILGTMARFSIAGTSRVDG